MYLLRLTRKMKVSLSRVSRSRYRMKMGAVPRAILTHPHSKTKTGSTLMLNCMQMRMMMIRVYSSSNTLRFNSQSPDQVLMMDKTWPVKSMMSPLVRRTVMVLSLQTSLERSSSSRSTSGRSYSMSRPSSDLPSSTRPTSQATQPIPPTPRTPTRPPTLSSKALPICRLADKSLKTMGITRRRSSFASLEQTKSRTPTQWDHASRESRECPRVWLVHWSMSTSRWQQGLTTLKPRCTASRERREGTRGSYQSMMWPSHMISPVLSRPNGVESSCTRSDSIWIRGWIWLWVRSWVATWTLLIWLSPALIVACRVRDLTRHR